MSSKAGLIGGTSGGGTGTGGTGTTTGATGDWSTSPTPSAWPRRRSSSPGSTPAWPIPPVSKRSHLTELRARCRSSWPTSSSARAPGFRRPRERLPPPEQEGRHVPPGRGRDRAQPSPSSAQREQVRAKVKTLPADASSTGARPSRPGDHLHPQGQGDPHEPADGSRPTRADRPSDRLPDASIQATGRRPTRSMRGGAGPSLRPGRRPASSGSEPAWRAGWPAAPGPGSGPSCRGGR